MQIFDPFCNLLMSAEDGAEVEGVDEADVEFVEDGAAAVMDAGAGVAVAVAFGPLLDALLCVM